MWSADESQDPDPFFEAADDAEVPAPAFAPAAPEPGASADPSDVDVSRDDIIARIEALTEGVVRGLLGGQLFALRIPLRNRGNVQLRQEGGYQLGQATKLVECSPSNAAHYVKYWKVLDAIVRLLRSGKKAAQRDLYYMLVDSFRSQTEINEIVQDLAAMLRCSRHALGIVASSRGFVAGRLLWRARRTTELPLPPSPPPASTFPAGRPRLFLGRLLAPGYPLSSGRPGPGM
eukprot:tig00000128_g7220.t1